MCGVPERRSDNLSHCSIIQARNRRAAGRSGRLAHLEAQTATWRICPHNYCRFFAETMGFHPIPAHKDAATVPPLKPLGAADQLGRSVIQTACKRVLAKLQPAQRQGTVVVVKP